MCCFEQILEAAPTKQYLYGHLPPHITKQFKKDEQDILGPMGEVTMKSYAIFSNEFQQLAKTCFHQIYADTRYCLEDLSRVRDERDE